MNKLVPFLSVVAVFFGMSVGLPAAAQQPLDGTWAVKFPDGSPGTMSVTNGTLAIAVPSVGDLNGAVELRTDYFESILDRRNGIDFIFGYLKAGGIEGKLQESAPCAELKKAFRSGVVEAGSSCQAAFTATKK